MTLPLVLVALGYGAYLIHAYVAGTLYFYIHPTYILPTLITGLVLVSLGGLAALAPRRRRPVAGTPGTAYGHAEHDRGPSHLALALLALPLLLGFGLTPKPLGLSAALQRGVDPTALGRSNERKEFRVEDRPEAYTVKDWARALQANPEPRRHAGRPVRVTGFVYFDRALPDGWFLVARFVVRCCAVDATPIGIPVRVAGSPLPKEGAWVSVEGRWEVSEVSGERRAVVAPTAVASIEPPEQPYLY